MEFQASVRFHTIQADIFDKTSGTCLIVEEQFVKAVNALRC